MCSTNTAQGTTKPTICLTTETKQKPDKALAVSHFIVPQFCTEITTEVDRSSGEARHFIAHMELNPKAF